LEQKISEDEQRALIVAEARSWLWTPQEDGQCVKGWNGGVDCARFVAAVFSKLTAEPINVPGSISAQWFMHKSEEHYLNEIEKYCSLVAGPPERWPKPGDIVIYRIAHAFAHSCIVFDWPQMINLNPQAHMITMGNAQSEPYLLGRERRFYSFWK